MYKKTLVITDDSYIEYECYSDGTYWNRSARVLFTDKQLSAWLADSPYTFTVTDEGAILNFEDSDFVPVVRFNDEQGNPITAYDMEGYCFMYADEWKDSNQ